jgi:hypothetical protein
MYTMMTDKGQKQNVNGCQRFEGEEGLRRVRVKLKEEERIRVKEEGMIKNKEENSCTLSDCILQ